MQEEQLLEAFRKELHKHPEVSGEERETQNRIRTFLEENGVTSLADVGRFGLVATFEGKQPGKEIWIRGDMDALPIQEVNTFEYASVNEGVSHKCGHDGHTTILSGLALRLNKQGVKNGKVKLLFQPAEENGRGAKSMLEDDHLKNENPDFVFALHNLPGYKKETLVIREGAFTAAVKSVAIRMQGKTSHAAEPEMGQNPARAMAEITLLANKLENPDLDHERFTLFVPVYSTLGSKDYGISAGFGESHFTIRSWDSKVLDSMCATFEEKAREICERFGVKPSFTYFEEFETNMNHPDAVDLLKKASKTLDASTEERAYPFKWGEDFGLFTQRFKGAMIGVGAGENLPALHNPDYDYPDEITPFCIDLFKTIIEHAH